MSGFNSEVDAMLANAARGKGYANRDSTGTGEKGPLWELCHNLPHPIGEIIYKAVRYHHKHEPDDLIKVAAWARLAWEEHIKHADAGRVDDGSGSWANLTRTVYPGSQPSRKNPRKGDAGGDARGSGRGALTEALKRAQRDYNEATGRVEAGLRRGMGVDKKSRRGKGKGRK